MCTNSVLVAIFVVCGTVITALRVPLGEEFIQEEAHLSISNNDENSLPRQKRDLSVFPEHTNISIKTNSRGEVLLNLQRSRTIDVNIPVYGMKDGTVQLKELETLQNVAVYKDIRNGASLILERVELDMGSNNFSLFGTFHTQGEMFVIQPREMVGHVVSRVPKQTTVFEMSPIIKGRTEYKTPRTNVTRPSERTKRQASENMVEVFIVTDFELYNFWYAMTSGSNRVEKTKQSIRQYMSYVLNEMDMRYSNMGRSDYSIGILSAGLFIADSASAASWSENSKFLSGTKYRLNSDSTLDTFRDWVNQQSFPSNDHVMGFTGYDLSSGSSGDGTGIAFTEALCTSSSVSLVEDRLAFISMTTATHELGHSLGALHDGDNNGCTSDDNYVMSVVNQISDDPIKGPHLWVFSSCSKDAFKSYIDSLNVIGDNCMLTTSSGSMPATVDTPMAQLYTPDDTCVYALGAGSYVCRSIQTYSTICISMYCNDPGTTQCYTVLPAEGTSCGNGKWCQNGQCVASSDAPSDVTDNCPIGDQPYAIDGYGQTCIEIIASDPGTCYNSYILTVCCQSCQNVNTGVTDCEFGDKNVNQCSQMSRFGCYNNEAFCCAKCAAIKNTQIPGCEFGDRLSGCAVEECAIYSQISLEGCCETCFDGTTVTTTTSTTTTTKPTTATTTSTTSSTSTSTTSSTSTTTTSTTRTSTTPLVTSTSSTVTTNGSVTTMSTPEESQGTTMTVTSPALTNTTSHLTTTSQLTSTTLKSTPLPTTTQMSSTPNLTTTQMSSTPNLTSTQTSSTPYLTTSQKSTTAPLTTSTATTTQRSTTTTTPQSSTTSRISTTATAPQLTSIATQTPFTAQTPTTSKQTTTTTTPISTQTPTGTPINTTPKTTSLTTSTVSSSTLSSLSASTIPPSASFPVTSTEQSTTAGRNESGSTTDKSEGSDIVIIGAGAAGGVIVLVIIIILVCVLRKRRSKSADKSGSNGTYDNIGFVQGAPNRPPPRRLETEVRAQPPISRIKPNVPIKPSAPIRPLSINKSDYDGYMMPASPEVKTISNGVMYTAPDKSAMRHANNPNLLSVIGQNDTHDPQKRTSKTIHYKRPSELGSGDTSSNHRGSNQSDTETDRRPSGGDVYDSIGHVDEGGHVAKNGHVPAMYHKPYKVHTPELPKRPSPDNQHKPSHHSSRHTTPMLSPGKDHTTHVNGTRSHTNTPDINKDKIRVHKDTEAHKAPMTPPRPTPRHNKNRKIENVKSDTRNVVGVYDTSDGVGANSFPLKPPNKPVPRRKSKDSLDNVEIQI